VALLAIEWLLGQIEPAEEPAQESILKDAPPFSCLPPW